MKTAIVVSLLILGVLSLSAAVSWISFGYASNTQTENFYLNLPGMNVKCNAEDFNMTVNSVPAQGSYPFSSFPLCTIPAYAGPALSVSSVTVTLYTVDEGCGSTCQVSGSMTDMGSSGKCNCGTVYSFPDTAVTVGTGAHKCSNAEPTTIDLTSGTFGSLVSGDYYQAVFTFTGDVLLCSGGNTPSLIAVTGSPQTGVPQFPLGLFAILGIAMPALIMLRARYSTPKVKSS